MFLKKCILDKSHIHGVGLFANENIKKGEIIWLPSNTLTFHFTESGLASLHPQEQEMVRHYGYFHKDKRIWHLSAEDSRYINHSDTPNIERTTNTDDGVQAIRDIKKGEELTQNYRDFEELRSF